MIELSMKPISYFRFIHVNLLAFIINYFLLVHLVVGIGLGVLDFINGDQKEGVFIIVYLLGYYLLFHVAIYIHYKRILKKLAIGEPLEAEINVKTDYLFPWYIVEYTVDVNNNKKKITSTILWNPSTVDLYMRNSGKVVVDNKKAYLIDLYSGRHQQRRH